MPFIDTPLGRLGPFEHVTLGPGGQPLACVPSGPVRLDTPVGRLTAQHSTDDLRRPKVEPMLFHPDGALKSMALEQRTPIPTPVGVVEAELVSFHPDGSLRRVFPQNGKLSGYWTEKEEGSLARPLRVPTPAGEVLARVVALCFFPSGALRSVTLWPGETVSLSTPTGRHGCRIGFSFHESGALRSFEPAAVIRVSTPIGPLSAFDPDALGIHGDLCSLAFHPDGALSALATPSDTLEVTLPDGSTRRFAPERTPNLCDENVMDVKSLRIAFGPGTITLGSARPETFPVHGHRFTASETLDGLLAPIGYTCGR